MSRTLFVEYRDNGFWAYDVAAGILLKHMIDSAESYKAGSDADWLTTQVSSWRVTAVVGSSSIIQIDEQWSAAQTEMFLNLVEEACRRLEQRAAIPAEEIQAWDVFDGERVFARGDPEVATAPVVELGRAMISLVKGSLPEPPRGTCWFYGTPSGRRTIEMCEDWRERMRSLRSTPANRDPTDE